MMFTNTGLMSNKILKITLYYLSTIGEVILNTWARKIGDISAVATRFLGVAMRG